MKIYVFGYTIEVNIFPPPEDKPTPFEIAFDKLSDKDKEDVVYMLEMKS